MLTLKIITYVFAFGAAIGQFVLDYVVKDRESYFYKRTRVGLFVMLFISLIASIGLLIKEDIRSNDLNMQVVELKGLIIGKDNNAINRERKAQEDRDKLLLELNNMNNKMEPFINIAKEKYPREDIDIALKNILLDIKSVKAMAAPNVIKFQKYDVRKDGNNYIVKIRFKPEKNIPLGILQFIVSMPHDSGAKIINIWPNAEGGAFQTGNESKLITANSESARIMYSLLGAGFPTIDVTVSKLISMQIVGNNGLETFILKPEMH